MPAHTIDWDAIRRRIEATEAAISAGPAVRSPEGGSILQARARAAATPPGRPDERERLEILGFSLAGESYGIETCYVREVRPLKDLTVLPCTPPFIAGVMNLHGQILAVVDLRKFFELPGRGLTELNRVLVLGIAEAELGLLADSIEGVRSVVAADLQQGLATLTGIRGRFLRGVTAQISAVLDGDRLLTDATLRVDESVRQ